METVYINARCQKILYYLLAENDYMPLQRIADMVEVSKRSVYYDLCKINEWLSLYGLAEIEVERGKGILIQEEEKKQIEEVLEDENRIESYVFSPMERVRIIICYIIYLGKPVYIEQLSKCCQVSRNTIFNDLRVIVSQLQEYSVSLVYESKKGYRIEGDIIRVRALFFLYFHDLKPLFDSGVLNFINYDELEVHLGKLQGIEKELHTEYVDGILFSLASLIPLMYKSKERPYFPNLRNDEIKKRPEYSLVLQYFPDLDIKEQIYLCLHLLGSRVAVAGNDIFDNKEDQTVYAITKALVAEFEKVACIIFEDKEELERALFLHISTSLYRYQYGIQVGNPMSTDVTREYPSLVDITKRVSKYLMHIVGIPIPDSEVAYLALHFGAHLKIARPVNEKMRILIVCANGVSTGNMLRREIKKLLPDVQIVDVVAAIDVVNVKTVCDLVITTVKIKSEVPMLVVHPILTDADRKVILDYVKPMKSGMQRESDRLFSILQKYIQKKDYDKIKNDLVNYFNNAPIEEFTFARPVKGIIDFLHHNEILITDDHYTWQDAIWQAGKKIIANKSVEKKYLDTIISQIQYYGPYMFIAKGVVLAHAKPEDGVNKLDVSFTVFKQPVYFSELHEAYIIIMLAAEDQESHLKILKDIMDIFSDENANQPEKIAGLESPAAVLNYLQQCIQ